MAALIEVSGLILVAPGALTHTRFFDELIPPLDRVTEDMLHVSSFGDATCSGDNFRSRVIHGKLQSNVATLASNWESQRDRWNSEAVAVSAQIDTALATYGLSIADLPGIVFPFGNAIAPAVLRVPPNLLDTATGRTLVAGVLLSELSAQRFRELMAPLASASGYEQAIAWTDHIKQVGARLGQLRVDLVPGRDGVGRCADPRATHSDDFTTVDWFGIGTASRRVKLPSRSSYGSNGKRAGAACPTRASPKGSTRRTPAPFACVTSSASTPRGAR